MDASIDILAIDDDKISRKIIGRSLEAAGMVPRFAETGEEGLAEAQRHIPDIVLLDVEMPGLNGYEVCDRLRHTEATKDVPVVFLSSHSSLRERMLGYEMGGDDYLVKPFEPENLIARIRVLIKYREEQQVLQAQYEQAQKTAFIAMTGTSELGMAVQFVEKSYAHKTYEELADELFGVMHHLQLQSCLMIMDENTPLWFSSEGSISPLEKELIEMADKDMRFFDFGANTIINYPTLSLLVKNMPLDDPERYGQIKDLMPVMLSAANAKNSTISVEMALLGQSRDLLSAFGQIRAKLYYLARGMLDKQEESGGLLREMAEHINYDLLSMGLEEDQEDYLLARIDTAIDDAMERIDSGETIYYTLSNVLASIKGVMQNQEHIVEAFTMSQAVDGDADEKNYEGDIELF
ncbi:MAG: histidine kinase [Gammaproteobacteria bacterium (ex Lamellibrachia satsuma)]|nr:MAG: response regulator [Gammaproteobacteria bacterium (ex Lamellibrachia satsuma)]RRS34103.1 MAG: histidine kinase [Gammaproteobacteria bacterium (ex Lamellibrachia satsuma)]RRS36049.1 MAG: histidine kinase [Gammaproteobacteria bacterium (ex Lamellibrachia satsuma)]